MIINVSFRMATLILILVWGSLWLSSEAEAGLKLCNRSSKAIWLALAEGKDAQHHAQGWYGLEAGACQSFFGPKLKNRYYYAYAFDAAGNIWEGAFNFCVHPTRSFTILGEDYCGERLQGAETRGFFEIDVRDALQFTHVLSGPEDAEPVANPEVFRRSEDDSLEATWARQDYDAVLSRVRPAAEAGEAWALNILGLMYLYGYGLPQSYREGAKWIQQAAVKGWGKAQYNLARLLYEAPDGAVDMAQVVHWLRLAALQGIGAAQQSLQAIQQTPQLCGTHNMTAQPDSRRFLTPCSP